MADPLFVDPAGGDFRVKDGSPALRIGFTNFPMNQFGVKRASLKALARTSIIPDVTTRENRASGEPQLPSLPVPPLHWLGAELRELTGEEFSAYGTPQENGGVAITNMPVGSAAADAGLRTNDLIQALNGSNVSGTAQLFRVLPKIGNAPLKLHVLRNQAETVLKLAVTTEP